MTYLQFHFLFNFPLILFFTFLQRDHPFSQAEGMSLGIVFLAVGLFTSPWDNHAVKKGIWGFPDRQHLFKIHHLPIEEYLFFFLQSLLLILSTRVAYIYFPQLHHHLPSPLTSLKGILAFVVAILWISLGRKLKTKVPPSRWNYVIHLFFWFTPIVLLQWIIGWEVFSEIPLFLLGISLFWGIYYTLCDLIATKQGIWHFDNKQIQGGRIFGILPWEESAFFWITSLLVAQSYILLLPALFR